MSPTDKESPQVTPENVKSFGEFGAVEKYSLDQLLENSNDVLVALSGTVLR